MKKLLALLLAVLMLTTLFAGCGKSEEAPADKPADAPAEEPAKVETPADEAVVLDLMWLNQSPEVTRWAELIVEEFEAENPNVDVQMNVVNQEEYFTKLQTLVAAGECPDVFWEWNAEIGSMIEANKLVDLAIHMSKVDAQ